MLELGTRGHPAAHARRGDALDAGEIDDDLAGEPRGNAEAGEGGVDLAAHPHQQPTRDFDAGDVGSGGGG
ncbi:MAG: hypothetical protein HYS27_19505 [Deltaproteobacteria bacterium]|nr:hypothetical protein [Deltaproteobacteria bacterium]